MSFAVFLNLLLGLALGSGISMTFGMVTLVLGHVLSGLHWQ